LIIIIAVAHWGKHSVSNDVG